MPSFHRFASIAVVLLTVSAIGRAQGVAPQKAYSPQGYPQTTYPQAIPATGLVQPGATSMERMSVVDPDKKLSAGDQVTVEIVEDREGGLQRMVTATGELDVPPLGRVRVAGRTATEAAGEIKLALERDYYYHATVKLAIDRISPLAVRSGLISLSGEVRIGGPQEIISGETLTLTNAILKAGGIGEWGNAAKVQLTRQRKDGSMETIVSNYEKIIKSGDAKLDPVLQDGDRIFVPRIWFRVK
jgi:protein involved in polysaccharide export with SLBB domain